MHRTRAEHAAFLLEQVRADPNNPNAGMFAEAAARLLQMEQDEKAAEDVQKFQTAMADRTMAAMRDLSEKLSAKFGKQDAQPITSSEYVVASVDYELGQVLLQEAKKYATLAALGHDGNPMRLASWKDTRQQPLTEEQKRACAAYANELTARAEGLLKYALPTIQDLKAGRAYVISGVYGAPSEPSTEN